MTGTRLIKQIELLEEEGLKLGYKAKFTRPVQSLRDTSPDVFSLYEAWKIKLLNFADTCKDRDFIVAVKKADGVTSSFFTDIAFKEKMPSGPVRYGLTNEKMSYVEMDKESIAQLRASEKGIAERMDALSNLRKRLSQEPTKLITIRVGLLERNLRRIVPEGEDKISDFRHSQGFDFILKIMSSPKPVAGKNLPGESLQAVSTGIQRVNKKVREDLRLNVKKNLIINPKGRSGYRFNDAYDVAEDE